MTKARHVTLIPVSDGCWCAIIGGVVLPTSHLVAHWPFGRVSEEIRRLKAHRALRIVERVQHSHRRSNAVPALPAPPVADELLPLVQAWMGLRKGVGPPGDMDRSMLGFVFPAAQGRAEVRLAGRRVPGKVPGEEAGARRGRWCRWPWAPATVGETKSPRSLARERRF